ncbi:MAG: hypothetical protein ABI862_18405, partial [Ilumatobacteraceae bacterium]
MTTIVTDVSHITKVLLELQRRPKLALARYLDITSSGLSKKLSGDREWTAKEIAAMSNFFDVPVTVFFGTVEELRSTIWERRNPWS